MARLYKGLRSQTPRRLVGRQISEATFVDDDGLVVSATLNLDESGRLFEPDLWKVDNSRLRAIPPSDRVDVHRSEPS